MKTLEHNQLLRYLRHAINLEGAVVTQNQIIEQYNEISKSKEPRLEQHQEPERPQRTYIKRTFDDNPMVVLLGYGVGGLFALFALFSFTGAIDGGSVAGGMISLIFASIFLGMVIIPAISDNKKQKAYGRT